MTGFQGLIRTGCDPHQWGVSSALASEGLRAHEFPTGPSQDHVSRNGLSTE